MVRRLARKDLYLLTGQIYDIYTEILGAAYKAQSRDFHFGTIFAPAVFLVGVLSFRLAARRRGRLESLSFRAPS